MNLQDYCVMLQRQDFRSLVGILATIDIEKYPERAGAVREEIESRKEKGESIAVIPLADCLQEVLRKESNGGKGNAMTRMLSLVGLLTAIATAKTPEWLETEIGKIGVPELEFVEAELEEGSFIYSDGFGKKDRYLFVKKPLSVGHVEYNYVAKNGRLTEIGIKTSRTVSMLKNVTLTDSLANELPYARFREVCAILENNKKAGGSHCEGSLGKVFVKAKMLGDGGKRFDLYLSTTGTFDSENAKASPGRFGLGKANTLVIDKETLSIPFDQNSAYFWKIEFKDTTAKKVELKVKFPRRIDAGKYTKGMRKIDDRQVALDFGVVTKTFEAEFGIDPGDQEGNYSVKLVGGGKLYAAVAYSITKDKKRQE